MIRLQHRFTVVAFVAVATVVVGGCGGDSDTKTKVDRKTTAPAEPLRPDRLGAVAWFNPGGTNPISTELEQVGDDTWLLTYGTETRTNNLDGSVAVSRDNGASWRQLDTGKTFATKGPDAFNSASSIGDTWVLGGVWGAATSDDDPYLPGSWWSDNQGGTWTRVILPVLPDQNGIINDMIRWNDAIYAVGQFQPDGGKRPRTGAVWRSEDGKAWTIVGTGEMFSGGSKDVYLTSIAASADGLAIAGTLSRTGDAFAGRDSIPVLWTSTDGADWNERVDLERPGAQINDLEIGGADGRTLVASGRVGTDERPKPWFEVAQLVPRGGKLIVEISRDQEMRSVSPATSSRGIPGSGTVRGLAWNAGEWNAIVVGTFGSKQPATLWRSRDALTFTPLGPADRQPRFSPNTLDALGDLELRDGLLLTTGRASGTNRIGVYRGRAD